MSSVNLLADLVAIPSVNPDLVPGAGGEGPIADFCARWLGEHGFEVHRLEDRPGRPSVVGLARGSGGGRSLLLLGHCDTVSLEGYEGDPLAAERRDGRLYGRGAYDMKGGVAAMMTAAARARDVGLRGDLLVASVADEEYRSIGTEEVTRHFRADGAIVTEPTHLDLVTAHKGFAWFEVVVRGRAAHGSRPDLGIDAIARAGHFLVGLEDLQRRLAAGRAHPRLGTGSVHASLIRGGQELSSYPAECRVSIERRTIPGEDAGSVTAELEAIIRDIRAQDLVFDAELVPGLVRSPFEIDADQPIVRTVREVARQHLDRDPALRAEPYWTDCAILADAGIPSVLFGASGDGAHAVREWADEESVEKLAGILRETAIAFCGTA